MICMLITAACRNPFLPPTGVPVNFNNEMRSTPQGVINQLIDAYENRQIDLYEDLFPRDGSFRFFVAPVYYDSEGEKYRQFSEAGDPRLQFISQNDSYYYWEQDGEIERHARLFSRTLDIQFLMKPFIAEIRKFVDNGDSLSELKVTGGLLEISYYKSIDTIQVFSTEPKEQVFLLSKDDEDLWVISKWYDFSVGKGAD